MRARSIRLLLLSVVSSALMSAAADTGEDSDEYDSYDDEDEDSDRYDSYDDEDYDSYDEEEFETYVSDEYRSEYDYDE